MKDSRQENFSQSIDLRKLERENRKYLYFGVLLSIVLYAGAAVFTPGQIRTKIHSVSPESRRIITTDIIPIPERNHAVPFVLKKPPPFVSRPRSPRVPRSGLSLPDRANLPGRGTFPLFRDQPGTVESEPFAFGVPAPEIDSRAAFPRISGDDFPVDRKGPKDRPLREEMLRPEDYIWSKEGVRTGRIEYNPRNKLALRGIVPIPIVFSNDGQVLSPGMNRFREGIQIYTDFSIGKIRRFFLTQNTPLDYPFLYISRPAGSEGMYSEARRLSEYIRSGGFVFFESSHDDELTHNEDDMRDFIARVLGPRYKLRPLPNDHPIYSCYFDFPDGPPINPESTQLNGTGRGKSYPSLDGVVINGRLVAVFSNKAYGSHWEDEDYGGAGLRMAINIFIYALRQDGGFAVKTHDYELAPGIQAQRNIAGLELSPETGKSP